MEDFNTDDQLITFLREYNRIFAYPTKTTATFIYKVDPETGIEPESNEYGIDSIMITGSFFGGKTITGRDFDFARDLLFTRIVKKMDYGAHVMVKPLSAIECDLPGVCLGDIPVPPTYAYEYFNGSKKLVSLVHILESKEKKYLKMYDIYLNNQKNNIYYNTKTGSTYVPVIG